MLVKQKIFYFSMYDTWEFAITIEFLVNELIIQCS